MCNGIIQAQAARDQVLPSSCSHFGGRTGIASYQHRGRFIHRKAEAGADEPLNRSQEVEKFYTTWTWRKCRRAYAEAKGNLCERCLSKGIIEPGSKDRPLEVHHKIPLTPDNMEDPKVALNWDNLELLCMNCHNEEHGKHKHDRRYMVDEFGRILC